MSASTRRSAAAGAGAKVELVRRAEAAAAAATEEEAAPSFDSMFSSSTPFFFYHIICPSTASLAVQVLGPNLAFKFTHSSALTRGIFSERAIEAALYKKTTGFLCLVPPPPPPPSRTPSGSVLSSSHPRASRPCSGDGQQTQRKILAWAESGHGLGPAGDCLDVSSPCTLPNGIWTQRALHLSSLLGVQMGHPFDRLGLGGRVGMFRASHVEVKLATHAVHVLLRLYNITRPANPPPSSSSARRANAAAAAITLRDLARLKSKITHCSSPPSFEIYFSKKNCHACAAWVRKVRDVTGVQIKLCWRDRLVKIQYAASPGMGCAPLPSSSSSSFLPPPCPVQDEASPDGRTAVVDLTDTPDSDDSHPGGGGREGGGEMEEDLSIGGSTPQPLGSYINGLAYCVGQMDSSGRPSRRITSAIVGLARMSRWQRARRRRHTTLGRTTTPRIRAATMTTPTTTTTGLRRASRDITGTGTRARARARQVIRILDCNESTAAERVARRRRRLARRRRRRSEARERLRENTNGATRGQRGVQTTAQVIEVH